MRPLVTPEEMASADKEAIDSGTPVEVLMERAGRAVARIAIQLAGGRYGRRATVVCGKGNNGGDGFVAARVLRSEGLSVRCSFVGDIDEVRGAARDHLDALTTKVDVGPFRSDILEGSDVVIDALFGTGFRGRAEAVEAEAIAAMNAAGCPIVAVDIPSGVNGETGEVAGVAVDADVTVAMGAQKIGTAVGEGAVHAGLVEVAGIGIKIGSARAEMPTRADIGTLLPERDEDSHKRSRGSVAILGGSTGMSGAVILAARGAMRAGAGYVTAGVTSGIQATVSSSVPEVLTRALTQEEGLGPESLEEFKPVLERATALAIGPGLGKGRSQEELVKAVLSSVDLPIVVDADGLNVLSSDPTVLSERDGACVITPHPAELARLMGGSVEDIQTDRVAAAERAASRFGCVVLLKGFRSIIAGGDRLVVNPTGGPSLATAGTGDVLTGVVATFLAQGLEAFDAAVAGAYVHGLAGDISGEEGVVAGDVADSLPFALEEL